MNWIKKLFDKPTIIKYREMMAQEEYEWMLGAWVRKFDNSPQRKLYVLGVDCMETHMDAYEMHKMIDWSMVCDLAKYPMKYERVGDV